MKLPDEVNQYVHGLPAGSQEKVYYLQKIKKYSGACGCSTGAKFLFTAMTLLFFYLIFLKWHGWPDMLKRGLMGFPAIFFFGLLGKLTGIAMARIKLTRICQRIQKQITLQKTSNVNMHPMGRPGRDNMRKLGSADQLQLHAVEG
jgi:hypothetical protein